MGGAAPVVEEAGLGQYESGRYIPRTAVRPPRVRVGARAALPHRGRPGRRERGGSRRSRGRKPYRPCRAPPRRALPVAKGRSPAQIPPRPRPRRTPSRSRPRPDSPGGTLVPAPQDPPPAHRATRETRPDSRRTSSILPRHVTSSQSVRADNFRKNPARGQISTERGASHEGGQAQRWTKTICERLEK